MLRIPSSLRFSKRLFIPSLFMWSTFTFSRLRIGLPLRVSYVYVSNVYDVVVPNIVLITVAVAYSVRRRISPCSIVNNLDIYFVRIPGGRNTRVFWLVP